MTFNFYLTGVAPEDGTGFKPIFFVTVHGFRVSRWKRDSGLGKRLRLDSRNARKNTGFATSSPSTMFRICGQVEAGVFPVQNAYKIAYGDENTTFESRCKRETFEPVNGYNFSYSNG